jgi:transcriptional regulator with XRE-family HTH domain
VWGILQQPMPTFSENLRRLRDECALTQVELARRSGLTQSAISRYETGEDVPELSSLLKLATGLRMPLEPLVVGLDMKFDLVYQGLRATVTTAEGEGTEVPSAAEFADPPTVERIVPDAPEFPDPGYEPTDADLEAARSALRRAASDILSVTQFLVPRPAPVARREGSEVRRGTVRARMGKSAKHRPTRTRANTAKRR